MSWYGAHRTEPELEGDDELRRRLRYVASPDYERAIAAVSGEELELLAWCLGLKRRRL